MVDKIQDNDEYEFGDYDTISPDPMGRDEGIVEKHTRQGHALSEKNNVIRNTIIAIVVIIVALVVYKFISSFTKKTTPTKASIPSVTTSTNQPGTAGTSSMSKDNVAKGSTTPVATTPPVTSGNTLQPTQPTEVTPIETTPSSSTTTTTQTPSSELLQIDQKVSALDITQQNIRSDISALMNQLTSINTNISNLTVKMDNLNQIITTLSATLEKQANQFIALTVKKEPKITKIPKIKGIVRRAHVPRKAYYIQAVIPGRAWLIATNGSTLTVREGTRVPGYGVVKLIDPNQGRVLTSSGQIIRFSRQDS